MRRLPGRVVVLIVVVVVVVVGVALYAVGAVRAHQRAVASAPTIASTDLAAVMSVPHIVFRSTLPGSQYGVVAAVPLDDPSGPRAYHVWTLIHEIPEGNWAGAGKIIYYEQVKGLVADD